MSTKPGVCIKHLVISGGGPTLIQILSCIQHLEEKKFLDTKKIESIYATSAGAIMGTIICLHFDWETVNDYIIQRPWHDVFPVKVQNIFDSYTKKGVFDAKVFEKCFKPLLDAKDLPLDITLEDFYNYSKIELHFFTFDINMFQLEDISYKTHPKLSLLTAIQMTCALPVMVTPICIENKCYIDGGVVCNYPLKYCLDSKINVDEILGFKNQYDKGDENRIDSSSNLLEFTMGFLFKVIRSLGTDHLQPQIKYEINCKTELLSIEFMKSALTSIDTRKKLFESGIECADEFLNRHNINKSMDDIDDE
jgi:NTE family protein